MSWLRTLAVVCAFASAARAQTVVFSGVSAKASPGGGTRSVVLVGGRYFVFFDAGSGVAYATSPDGVTFSTPQLASTTPASYGFSVAYHGNTIGLVWANHDPTGYSLWYREATVANGTVTLGAPTQVATHAVDARGYLATLAYSAAGTPYIASLEYGQPYTGPIGPGCGSLGRFRPTHYLRQTGWVMRSYCNNFDTILEPNSITIAPSGQNMIVISLIDANLSTAIVNDGGELGEPWHMVPAVDHLLPGQVSAVGSVTQPTDVHVLFRDGAGALTYARQDGNALDLNAQMLDVTVLNPAARDPALSRPATAAGCYVAAYTVGNSIRWRTFQNTIGTMSPEATAFTTTSAPSNLSIELEAAISPALVWQEGDTIRFGFAPGGDPVALTASPSIVRADGSSMIHVTSTPFHDACGAPIAAGTPVTVTSSAGAIADADASAEFPATQVLADADGKITFTLRASTMAADAVVAAMPIPGGMNATVDVAFTDGSVPAVCGDGYVDVAGGEQCEDGPLCDPTTCRYNFSIGGGCAGCAAGTPDGTLWLLVCAMWLRRRRPRSR